MSKKTLCVTMLVALVHATAMAQAEDVGVVVLEAMPRCDHFVVQTRRGYTFLERFGSVATVSEGVTVSGDFHRYGFTEVRVDRRVVLRAWIDDFQMDEEEALRFFQSHC